jgi:hypothetical protein
MENPNDAANIAFAFDKNGFLEAYSQSFAARPCGSLRKSE